MSASPTSTLPTGDKLYGKPPADAGEWLFKDKEQVLGPVSAEVLLVKLYDGHVNADTPVALEIGKWKPLKEVWFLGPHVGRAQARQSYLRAEEDYGRMRRAFLFQRLAITAVAAVVSTGASYAGARELLAAKPWADKTDWLTKRPPLAPLPDRTPQVAAVTPTPEPAGAQAAARPEEARPQPAAARPDPAAGKLAREDKGGKGKGQDKAKPDGKDGKDKGSSAKSQPAVASAAKPAPTPEAKPEPARTAPPTALPTELTADQMKAVFKGGAGGYTQCIREEASRNPEMPAVITIEFVIKNDGTTGEFKVQEREVRQGTLATCLGQRIAALRFPQFSGERKVFIFPFKITRR